MVAPAISEATVVDGREGEDRDVEVGEVQVLRLAPASSEAYPRGSAHPDSAHNDSGATVAWCGCEV